MFNLHIKGALERHKAGKEITSSPKKSTHEIANTTTWVTNERSVLSTADFIKKTHTKACHPDRLECQKQEKIEAWEVGEHIGIKHKLSKQHGVKLLKDNTGELQVWEKTVLTICLPIHFINSVWEYKENKSKHPRFQKFYFLCTLS